MSHHAWSAGGITLAVSGAMTTSTRTVLRCDSARLDNRFSPRPLAETDTSKPSAGRAAASTMWPSPPFYHAPSPLLLHSSRLSQASELCTMEVHVAAAPNQLFLLFPKLRLTAHVFLHGCMQGQSMAVDEPGTQPHTSGKTRKGGFRAAMFVFGKQSCILNLKRTPLVDP